ncbi:unnamed protein product [Clonostachys rosea]|uniref:Agmatine deiminase n=1 Tax=Bionectria ochroleuca TaxID=29856 RepID=A0ABY6U2M8_BIOOC|nr:unnamed protein product [Clonostachys rosea]
MAIRNVSRLYRSAEWTRHARTILAWPGSVFLTHRDGNHPEESCSATREVSSIAEAIAQFEPVTVLVSNNRMEHARKRFTNIPHEKNITIQSINAEDVDLWMRDIGPTFVTRRGTDGKSILHGISFNWNGWGGKFSTVGGRALAAEYLHDHKIEHTMSSIVTEGGAIETDGEGTLLATESSILNGNRNPGKTRQDVEAELCRTLGIQKVIWVPGVKGAESTDCHIDAQARFVKPGVIVLSKPSDAADTVWQKVYDEIRQVLSSTTDAQGRSFQLVDIPEPNVMNLGFDDKTLQGFQKTTPVFNYVNYLMVNGGIVMPRFGDRIADEFASKTMVNLFGNERKVVTVLLKELPMLGGGIHCASQEIPYTDM